MSAFPGSEAKAAKRYAQSAYQIVMVGAVWLPGSFLIKRESTMKTRFVATLRNAETACEHNRHSTHSESIHAS